jgi:hypothetical protein
VKARPPENGVVVNGALTRGPNGASIRETVMGSITGRPRLQFYEMHQNWATADGDGSYGNSLFNATITFSAWSRVAFTSGVSWSNICGLRNNHSAGVK